MTSNPATRQAVGLLYEAAVWPDLMTNAMRGFAQLFAARDAVLVIMDRLLGRIEIEYYWTAPEDDGAYEEYYYRLDPRLGQVLSYPVGQMMLCHEAFGPNFVRRDCFFNEYLIPAGVRYSMGGKVASVDDHLALISIHRAPDQECFSVQDRQVLLAVLPDLARAVRMYFEVDGLRTQASIGEKVIASVDRALILTDDARRVHFANPAAEALLQRRRTLQVRRGQLHALVPADNARLAAALCDVARTSLGSELMLGGGEPKPLLVRVMPLPEPATQGGQRRILLSLVDLSASPPASTTALCRLLGLTRKEAELACALFAGKTLEEHANDQQVGYGTVRSQLRSVFEKLGVSRQVELVNLLNRLFAA